MYDVVVVGGGIGGCAAALAAKRQGKNVLLIEKLITLGGLATGGHITIYLPLDDGYGNQVISGISEELLKLSSKYVYYAGDYEKWKENGKRYECKYNGPAYSLALEELLLDEGIEILYDTLFAGCDIENDTVKAIYIENKSGRSKIECKTVVDASGDADVFFRAGEKCGNADNSLAAWLYATQGAENNIQKRGGNDAPGLELVSFGKIDIKAKKHIVDVPYKGATAEGINRFVIDSHNVILNYIKDHPDFVPASLPNIADIRMARRIEGLYLMSDSDSGKHFEDNVGCTGDWRRPGPVYELPYSSVVSKLKNVFACGRCIAAKDEAWEIWRCIPQAALSGQVAGTAASMIIDDNTSAQTADVNKLRTILSKNGIILDFNKEN